MPFLQHERFVIAYVNAEDVHAPSLFTFIAAKVFAMRLAGFDLETPVRIGAAARLNLMPDVRYLHDSGMHPGSCHKGAGAPVADDQTFSSQRRDSLVDGHARTAILLHQFMLERNPVASGPFTRNDMRFNVAANARVQGEFWQGPVHLISARSRPPAKRPAASPARKAPLTLA